MATTPVPGTAASQAESASIASHDDARHAAARKAMIASQLRPSGITDAAVLRAMNTVPREQYVMVEQRAIAYMDRSIPLGEGRALSAPLAQAMLLQNARPEPTDNTLLIGGGTGYLAALLAPMVASLHVVESDARLSGAAGTRPGDWHGGALTAGWEQGGPYDLIVIDGAVEELPADLAEQLADDGRVVTGLVERGVTRIALGRKAGRSIALQPLYETGIPVLSDFAKPKGWSF